MPTSRSRSISGQLGRSDGCSQCPYLKCDIDKLADENSNLEYWCKHLERVIENQVLELGRADNRISYLSHVLDERQESSLSIRLRWLERSNESLKGQINDMSKLGETSAKETRILRAQLNDVQRELQARTSEKDRLQKAHEELQKEAKDLYEECSRTDKNLEQLRLKEHTAKEQIRHSSSVIASQEASVAKLQNEVNSLSDERAHATRALEELVIKKQAIDAENQHLVATIADRDTSLEWYKNELGKKETLSLALYNQVKGLEVTELYLRRSISGCWLHSVRAWVGRIYQPSILFEWVRQLGQPGIWVSRVRGTIGWVGLF